MPPLSDDTARSAARKGFSLVELSIVVVIISLVAVAGLEAATQFIGQRSYDAAQVQLTTLDSALDQFYRVYGRLPCPAARGLGPLDASTNYGKEDCTITLIYGTTSVGGNGVIAGAIPFRTLNIPMSNSIDPYNDKYNYAVGYDLTNGSGNDTASGAQGAITVRSGTLAAGTFNALADSSVGMGAAYVIFSSGADKRGSVGRNGTAGPACAGTNDTRVDSQNCVYISGTGSTSPVINANVFYDARYNNGNVAANYFNDIVIWRQRGQL